MMTCTTVRMSSTSASTLAAHTSVNVNRICTLLMGNAEVIGNDISSSNGKKLFIKQYFAIAPAPESEHGLSIKL